MKDEQSKEHTESINKNTKLAPLLLDSGGEIKSIQYLK
jgi:hypothetical protein